MSNMPRSFLVKKNNYSNCPLKKRPLVFDLNEDIKTEPMDLDTMNQEPENLCTKPQDLTVPSSKSNTILPPPLVPIHAMTSSPRSSPIAQYPVRTTSPAHHHHQKPTTTTNGPLEPISLNLPAAPVAAYPGWHRGIPYSPYLPFNFPPHYGNSRVPTELYPHHYSPMYPSVSPVSRLPTEHQQLSPYAPSRDSLSPPSSTTTSPPLPPRHSPEVHPHHQFIHSAPPPLLRHSPPARVVSYLHSDSLTPPNSIGYSSPTSSPSPPAEDLSSSGVSMKHAAATVGNKDPVSSRYQCPDCKKSYSTFSGLTKHQQFHCVTQAKKSFCCKFCEKVYMSLGALKMHIRTHTLPCKCHLCGKAFSRPWLLQGHIRTHTGEKPFSCPHCSRAFADRSNLRAHLQTHSDVKKYSCKNCSKTFSRMSLLVKHEDGGCPGMSQHEKMCPDFIKLEHNGCIDH